MDPNRGREGAKNQKEKKKLGAKVTDEVWLYTYSNMFVTARFLSHTIMHYF